MSKVKYSIGIVILTLALNNASAATIEQAIKAKNEQLEQQYNTNRDKAYTDMKARIDAVSPQPAATQQATQSSPLQPVAGISAAQPVVSPAPKSVENGNVSPPTTGSDAVTATDKPAAPVTPNIFITPGAKQEAPKNIYR